MKTTIENMTEARNELDKMGKKSNRLYCLSAIPVCIALCMVYEAGRLRGGKYALSGMLDSLENIKHE